MKNYIKAFILTAILLYGIPYIGYVGFKFVSNIPQSLERGDKLELVNVDDRTRLFFKGCGITFLDQVATEDSSKIFVYLTDCSERNSVTNLKNPDARIFDARYLRKLNEN
jgi:hypothetical protein